MRRWSIAAAGLLLWCTGHASANQQQLIEEILDLSGVDSQLEEITRFAVGEIDNRKEVLAPEDYTKLRQQMADTFATDKLRRSVRSTFATTPANDRLRQWHEVLKSPLVAKMAKLEQATSDPAAFDAIVAYGESLNKNPPPQTRIALVQRLADATSARDLAMESHLAVTRTLLRAINPSLPENKRLDAKQEARILNEMRTELGDALQQVTTLTYLYTYRSVSDAELAEYTKLYESETGQWAVGLTKDAIMNALAASNGP